MFAIFCAAFIQIATLVAHLIDCRNNIQKAIVGDGVCVETTNFAQQWHF